jgi:hypothetical protein
MASHPHHTIKVGYLNKQQSELSIHNHQRLMREANIRSCEELKKLTPPNAFADDVIDDDVGHYYPNMTVVQGGLAYE